MDEHQYDSFIKLHAEAIGLPWLLIKSQIWAESEFNPQAKSSCGARGLMQLMPVMMQDMGEIKYSHEATFDDLVWIPEWNIETGTKYDRWLYDRFPEISNKNEKFKFMLAAYNCGRGYVNAALRLAREEEFGFQPLATVPGKWQSWDFSCRLLASPECCTEIKMLTGPDRGKGERYHPDYEQVWRYVDKILKKYRLYVIEFGEKPA